MSSFCVAHMYEAARTVATCVTLTVTSSYVCNALSACQLFSVVCESGKGLETGSRVVLGERKQVCVCFNQLLQAGVLSFYQG